MPSNAELYFKKIVSLEYGYDYLAKLPESRVQESEWLEFKSADRIKERDSDAHWSKALSGFANTQGGVLIWGIVAERDSETNIDCATSLALAPDAEGLAQRLNDVLLNAVVPPIRGVEIRAIKKNDRKEGFVACLIPEGTAKAYRAEISDKQFYLRIRDKFVIPSAAIIRSLFHRDASPVLVPSIWVSCDDTQTNILFSLNLTNKGTLTAEQMLIIMLCDAGTQAATGEISGVSKRLTMAHPREFAFELSRYLHPYMPPMTFAQISLRGVHTFPPVAYFRIRICCRNMAPTTWSCTIPRRDFFKHDVGCLPDEEPWPNQPEPPR